MKKKEIEYDLIQIRERLNQLECGHHIGDRKFDCNFSLLGIDLNEQCNSCGKLINSFDDDKKYSQAKLDWHKEMVKLLEDK